MAHISIESLTVEFAIFGASSRSLKKQILSHATGGRVMSGARDIVTVRAIENLNLEIKDGDRIGLIGHNGSGKTTLLRVLAGIYKPNSGAITIEGNVGALLYPTAGMDAESTGIENIYLRGYMMGMSRREIAARFDDIADFADLGDLPTSQIWAIFWLCRYERIRPECLHVWPSRSQAPHIMISCSLMNRLGPETKISRKKYSKELKPFSIAHRSLSLRVIRSH